MALEIKFEDISGLKVTVIWHEGEEIDESFKIETPK